MLEKASGVVKLLNHFIRASTNNMRAGGEQPRGDAQTRVRRCYRRERLLIVE